MTLEPQTRSLTGLPMAEPTPTPGAVRERSGRARLSGLETTMLAGWDLLTLALALAATDAFGPGARGWVARGLSAVAVVVVLSGLHAYQRTSWLREHSLQLLRRLLLAAMIVAWSGVLLTGALGLRVRLGPLIALWPMLAAGWYVGRKLATVVRRRSAPERILIVGGGEVAQRIAERVRQPGSGSVLVGCLDDRQQTEGDPHPLGGIDRLPALLAEQDVDRVIVAFSSARDYETLEHLRTSTAFKGAIDVVPRFFDFVGQRASLYEADGQAYVSIPGRPMSPGLGALKRILDIVGAVVLLVVLSPLLLLIAVTILVDSGRPVVFRQRRIGMHGRPFWILKFRTLSPAAEAVEELNTASLAAESIGLHVVQAKQQAAQRATRVGTFLRKTSLDELPQLWNVIAGEMSLVGPRPLSPLEDAVLQGWEVLRRETRPGITGLWQVSGRSEVSWEDRLSLDYAQVRHWSFSSDLRVLADTVREVLRRRGA
jgi:exopolysaccharide biosynthesis polyprenyl glycosylphosphotransferase